MPRHRSGDHDLGLARLRRLEAVATVPVSGGSLDVTLARIVSRLREALAADYAAVLLIDGTSLTVRTAEGDGEQVGADSPVPYGVGMLDAVAQSGTAKTLADVAADPDSPWERESPDASAAAAPLRFNDLVIGVVTVGHRDPAGYDESDLTLLEVAADRLTSALDAGRLREAERRASLGAARAREHVRMLGDSSRALLRSVDDYERPLGDVMSTVIEDFATLATVFLADGADRDLRIVAARLGSAETSIRLSAEALDPIRAAMSSGRGELRILRHLSPSSDPMTVLDAELAALGIASYVISPIQVRGLAFGALLFGTGEGVRGFRPADKAAIDDLAQRVALAIESNLLYRETRGAADAAARHMSRLRTLLDIRLEITLNDRLGDLLRVAAAGAGRLFPDCRITMVVGEEQYDETGHVLSAAYSPAAVGLLGRGAEMRRGWEFPHTLLPAADRDRLSEYSLVVPLAGSTPLPGFVVVEPPSHHFTDEDESLLALLVRMVSASLHNQWLNEQARTGAARMNAILGASPAAIVTLGPDLAVHGGNPAANELFGWDPDGDPGSLPPELVTNVASLAGAAATTREPQQADATLTTAETERTLVLMLAPTWTGSETDLGYVLVITDDTERRQLASQFQQAQRLDAIGRLAGGVAHDFNNLLTVIHGYTDGLLRRLDADDPNRERIAAIHRAGQRGAELTKQLLTISRQQVVTPIVLRPADAIDEMMDMMRRMVGESVRVVRERGEDDVRISIDKLQLEQVMLNLAANARDAMPNGGTLALSVHRSSSSPTGEPAPDDDSGWVELRFADDGVGMTEDELAHCIDPMFTTKDAGLGTGFGLSTVYGIATQNGGDLVVTSAPDRGTTVTVVLPEVNAPVTELVESPLPTPSDAAATGTGNILLVEDDHEIRWMVQRMLHERGYRVVTADNGLDAVDQMRQHHSRIDMLLTDVAMPGMNGPEVARAVRAIRPIPVLFMSGYAEQLGRAADRGDYPAEFLAKPFTPDELVVAVHRTLASTSALRGAQGSKR